MEGGWQLSGEVIGQDAASLDPQQESLQRTLRFFRDVWVNLLANIAAAAPIYLLGAAFDLLPKNRAAISTAMGIMAVTCGLAAWIAKRRNTFVSRALVVALVPLTFLITVGACLVAGERTSAWWLVGLLLAEVGLLMYWVTKAAQPRTSDDGDGPVYM